MKKAITLARNSQSVTVIAEDTDIFVLLMYHWTAGMAPIYAKRIREAKTRTVEIQ